MAFNDWGPVSRPGARGPGRELRSVELPSNRTSVRVKARSGVQRRAAGTADVRETIPPLSSLAKLKYTVSKEPDAPQGSARLDVSGEEPESSRD